MEELRQEIVNKCNESNLPIEALLFVIRDVYRDVEEAFRRYKEQIEQEKKGEE